MLRIGPNVRWEEAAAAAPKSQPRFNRLPELGAFTNDKGGCMTLQGFFPQYMGFQPTLILLLATRLLQGCC